MIALAPDSASEVAGRRLAVPAPWSDVGWADPLLWGACQGSGKTPYTVAVDVSGPTYRCSCPSRKFPCKHVLGLLFLWAEGGIREGGTLSAFASDWAARRGRGGSAADGSGSPQAAERTPEQEAAAAARAARREERVADGMAELEQWLSDQVTRGLAAARPAEATETAARMVDAQAPGVATRLREAARLPRGGRWLTDTFAAYSLLHLLARAATTLDTADPMRDTVRMRLGFTTSRETVLAEPAVTDRWLVAGMRDSDEEQVSVRRVWLHGMDTGTPALVLFFAPRGQALANPLLPGTAVDADLHFHPGRPRLRAVVGDQRDTVPIRGWTPAVTGVAVAVAAWRAALAADPWLTEWPVAVSGTAAPAGRQWTFTGIDGGAVNLVGSDLWTLLALTGGHPATVFGELGAEGLRPSSVLLDEEVLPL